MDILGHRKCTVYDIKKVSATRSVLVCVLCGKVCGWYEDDEQPEKEYPTEDSKYISDKNLDKWK